jgi:peptidoglycan/xylan/chitin deacetylase (PgdA/CDA1 family)
MRLPRLALLAALLTVLPARAQYTCDPTACAPPGCRCASTDPPGGLPAADVPQFVLVTFDDCIKPDTEDAIRPVLEELRNPDGEPVTITYFLSLADCPTGGTTDSSAVLQRVAAGDELAIHTVTHTTSTATTFFEWRAEIVGVLDYLASLGLERTGRGFRAPFVATNTALFDVLESLGILYDSSIYESPFFSPVSNGPRQLLWPYTLDFGPAQNCAQWADFNACTDDPKPGLWEIPIYYHVDVSSDGERPSDYLGTFDVGNPVFSFGPRLTGDALYRTLLDNFEARYAGNRAPYTAFLHATTFAGDDPYTEPYNRALRAMAARPDTWFVTGRLLIEWMRDPVPASQMSRWIQGRIQRTDRPAPERPLRVYPTVTTGPLTVTGSIGDDARVQVFDTLGRLLLERPVASGSTLDLSGLASGLYFVRVAGETRAVTVRR